MVLAWATILVAVLLLAGTAPPAPVADGTIHARIEQVRQRANAIRIDGNGTDWTGIPTFSDPAGDASDPSRDIVGFAVAPRERDLLLMVATASRPSGEDLAFWFSIDFTGLQTVDVQIGARQRGPSPVWIHPEDDEPLTAQIEGIEVATGEVVEVRIPYDALGRVLPAQMRDQLRGVGARSWVRVLPATWSGAQRRYLDHGPAVASYRLVAGRLSFDPPTPVPDTAPMTVPLPVRGQWYLFQGAHGMFSHHDVWAYDLVVVDPTLHPSRVRDSRRNSDYYAWGRSVHAPVSGRVVRVANHFADGPAGQESPPEEEGNHVLLDMGRGYGLYLTHLQQGSVTVAAGTEVRAGERLGRVGNSGLSVYPHLHVALVRLPDGRPTVPLAFASVRVGLNSGTDDPWARDLASWEPREGFFVQSLRNGPR
ncbi:MAG: M23 family metallopeptidase [Armatimonadota bacterium]|nr:M23 family metallopeptidase [Armatimonadota bacterium]MDR5697693.1 M23 family metallopeptidase [Armatimonadota bacterium]